MRVLGPPDGVVGGGGLAPESSLRSSAGVATQIPPVGAVVQRVVSRAVYLHGYSNGRYPGKLGGAWQPSASELSTVSRPAHTDSQISGTTRDAPSGSWGICWSPARPPCI